MDWEVILIIIFSGLAGGILGELFANYTRKKQKINR